MVYQFSSPIFRKFTKEIFLKLNLAKAIALKTLESFKAFVRNNEAIIYFYHTVQKAPFYLSLCLTFAETTNRNSALG